MQQQPRAGSVVAPKSDVRLWLVPGGSASNPTRPPAQEPPSEERVAVPSLEGRTVAEARADLARFGLIIGGVTETAGDGEPGTIARQEPRAGTSVAPKSAVRLWLVTARRAVVVPAIIGLPPARAQALLREAGLRPGAVGGTGVVVSHTFRAGASVPAGSVVDITLGAPPGSTGPVAAGPDSSPATPGGLDLLVQGPQASVGAEGVVPDVLGMRLAEAQSVLAAAGYAAAVDHALADSAAWTVSAQQPSPGGELAAGGVVALLLDAPAPQPVAAVAPPTPISPAERPQSVASAAWSLLENRMLWIALGALLLVAAGVQRMRGRRRVLPVAAVRARLRMDEPARVAVEGTPFRAGHLRFRMNPGRTATRVSVAGPLFVQKEVSGD